MGHCATLQGFIVQPKARPLTLVRPLVDKNFYLLALIQQDKAIELEIENDSDLATIARNQKVALSEAMSHSGLGRVTGLRLTLISDEVVGRASQALSELFDRSKRIREFVRHQLRESGAYQRFAKEDDKALLLHAWKDCARGMNLIVSVYGLQTTGPHSGEIDAPLYTLKNPLYGLLIHAALGVILDDSRQLKTFFDPNLELAQHLLLVQLRDEAARHEPMESSVNLLAYRQVRRTRFGEYPYSVIVVPGEGPEEEKVSLSPAGRLRLELAVHRFRDHKAPFILVSGGYVHPAMTPFSEAIEMKKCLIKEFGIPESAIIVDPHARHTTTNLRNASRLIYRYGIPFTKPGLIVSDPYQSAYIDSKDLSARNQNVFGFQPVSHFKRLGPYDVEFLPELVSLSIDPSDPLDP